LQTISKVLGHMKATVRRILAAPAELWCGTVCSCKRCREDFCRHWALGVTFHQYHLAGLYPLPYKAKNVTRSLKSLRDSLAKLAWNAYNPGNVRCLCDCSGVKNLEAKVKEIFAAVEQDLGETLRTLPVFVACSTRQPVVVEEAGSSPSLSPAELKRKRDLEEDGVVMVSPPLRVLRLQVLKKETETETD
jgi:hypothetical protein